ncbi:MAG TPA: response regulator [Verrucomicrobiae bacterium]|jgi:CheY-like chemotaxis protein
MKSAETSGIGRVETVVIVDDDEADIAMTRRVIEATWPQVGAHAVKSGEALIRYLQGEDEFSDREKYPYPTFLLLDLKMPGMHGFDVLRWLTLHPPHNLIPVVVLTASGQVPMAHLAYQLGARSFLTKPLAASEFENMIGKFEPKSELRKQGG